MDASIFKQDGELLCATLTQDGEYTIKVVAADGRYTVKTFIIDTVVDISELGVEDDPVSPYTINPKLILGSDIDKAVLEVTKLFATIEPVTIKTSASEGTVEYEVKTENGNGTYTCKLKLTDIAGNETTVTFKIKK